MRQAEPALRLFFEQCCRILGPLVLWVSSAELFPNFRIRVLPETRQVVRHLLWTHIRREKMQQDFHASACDARRFSKTEEILDTGRQHGWSPGFVGDAIRLPGRQ